MKAFLASLLILAILAVCSVINCIYIDKVCTDMLEAEKSFPEKSEDGKSSSAKEISEAEELWAKSCPRLLCFVKASYVNSVTNALTNLSSYYKEGSVSDYMAARAILREAIRSLAEKEGRGMIGII